MPHACFVCAQPLPGGFAAGGGSTLRVPARFQGPPTNVNGGMAVGMLACPVLQAAERDGIAHAAVTRMTARLRAGVPVDRELAVEVWPGDDGGYAVSVRDGETEVMTANADVRALEGSSAPGAPLAAVPEARAADVAVLAATPVPAAGPWFVETGDHPLPGCFSCGPDNPHGLHVYPRFARDGLTCAPWPHPDPAAPGAAPDQFDNGDGTLSLAVLTSAIDCSSGICMPAADQRELLDRDDFFLLGSMDVRYLRAAPSMMPYRVAAKALGRDGRKFYGLSVLAGEDGVSYAMAESTWIIANMSRTAAFGPRP